MVLPFDCTRIEEREEVEVREIIVASVDWSLPVPITYALFYKLLLQFSVLHPLHECCNSANRHLTSIPTRLWIVSGLCSLLTTVVLSLS